MCGHCSADSPSTGVLILRHRPGWADLARFARARLRGLIGEADMTAVLALAGGVFPDPTVIYGSTR